MKAEPVITVSMLTYNQVKYVAQAIESVLMQECNVPFELLIGDDFSTDGTRDVIMQYATKYPDIIIPVFTDKNVGAAKNGSNLKKHVHGQIISVLDGDDYWIDKHVLQKQYDIFMQNPDVDFVCAKAKCYIQAKGEFEGTLGFAGAEDLLTMFETNRDVAAPTIAYRTEAMKQCKQESSWFVEHNCFFDTTYAYWFAMNHKLKFVDEVWAVYRVLPNSACHATDAKTEMKYMRRYLDVKLRFILEHHIPVDDIYSILERDVNNLVDYAAYCRECQIRASKTYRIGYRIAKLLGKK